MRARALPLLLAFWTLAGVGKAQDVLRFRQWLEGTESGGGQTVLAPARIEERAWTRMERLGVSISQDFTSTATRTPEGAVTLTWSVALSSEPLVGEARWSPGNPGILHVAPKGGSPVDLPVPAGAVIWPGDREDRMREAARNLAPIHLVEFSGEIQDWTRMDLQPVGREPLPGFPGTVRFRGQRQEGRMLAEIEVWVSPQAGEVKQVAHMAGLTLVLQRAELPSPEAPREAPQFFERTLATLPAHPFLLWLPEATLRWEGQGRQDLVQDGQQHRLGENRYRVSAPVPPSAEEAAQKPVSGTPDPEDAPFLAATQLVQFQDPVFGGLLARLKAPKEASRWELAQRVTSFVFDWITEKDLAVGFASAREVARIPRGDCTEHGVLAVALLRRLGVPARGVVGWAGLDGVLGVHFWVEVKLGQRWVPIDPTFDEAPASALRLKVSTTDLSSLASIGWDDSSLLLVGGRWRPEAPWSEAIRISGDTVSTPWGLALRWPGARWSMQDGRLKSVVPSAHTFVTSTHPLPSVLQGARLLQGPATGRQGWWDASTRTLWADMGSFRWLQVDRMDEPTAFRFLDQLEVRF